MAQYLRQKGSNEIYAIVNGGAYYVPYDYALANNVFAQVKDVPGRVDQQYPIAGNVNDAPKEQAGSSGGQEGDTRVNAQGQTEKMSVEGKWEVVNSGGGTTGGGTTGTTPPTDSSTFGVPPEIWAKLSPGQQALLESMSSVAKDQWLAGQLDVSVNQDLLNKALTSAQSDPTIRAKYGDALKMDQENVSRSLDYIGRKYTLNKDLTAEQQRQDRLKLAQTEAEAGRAYSGFREQAKQRLAQEQSGVIESSRRGLQQQLEKAGQGLEKTYGTTGLGQFGPITAGGETYNPMGNITGSIAAQKKSDIEAKQQQIYQSEKL